MSERVNAYQDEEAMRASVAAGRQRDVIGGFWEEIGALQFEHLRRGGLRPHHKFIDLGCGSLRGGVHFARYLDAANYFGIDVSRALLDAGRHELELLGASDRVPAENLRVTDAFDLDGFPLFDYGIAQSLFTHLPADLVGACLSSARARFKESGRLFATFFLAFEGAVQFQHPQGITTYPDRDPFHYSSEHVERIAAQTGWTVAYLGPWGHPRDQSICELRPA